MTKFFVYDKKSEVSSEAFETREEAEKELTDNYMRYGLDAEIVEVDD